MPGLNLRSREVASIPTQPIEITADSLEVEQANQLAIFEGNVQVVQGNIRMRAAKLVVHYADKSQSKNGEPATFAR